MESNYKEIYSENRKIYSDSISAELRASYLNRILN